MVKKSMAYRMLGIFILGAIFLSSAAAPSFAKPMTLKVAGISAPEYRGTKSLFAIKEVVEKETEGRVILDIFPAPHPFFTMDARERCIS